MSAIVDSDRVHCMERTANSETGSKFQCRDPRLRQRRFHSRHVLSALGVRLLSIALDRVIGLDLAVMVEHLALLFHRENEHIVSA